MLADPFQQRRICHAQDMLHSWQHAFRRPSLSPKETTFPTSLPTLRPNEGCVSSIEAATLFDPLGILRARHDVEVFAEPKTLSNGQVVTTRMEECMWKQADILSTMLSVRESMHGESIPVFGDGRAEVVNTVHTSYTQRLRDDEHSLDIDDDSSFDEEDGTNKHSHPVHDAEMGPLLATMRNNFAGLAETDDEGEDNMDIATTDDDDKNDDNEEDEEPKEQEDDAASTNFLFATFGQESSDPSPPPPLLTLTLNDTSRSDKRQQSNISSLSDNYHNTSIMATDKQSQLRRLKANKMPSFSLVGLRRRWVPLGFHKTVVGTAVAVRYAVPFQTAQLAFTTDRIYTTGARRRRDDRILVKHGTLPFIYTPVAPGSGPARRVGAVRRFSQNFVFNHRLPGKRSICLGLLDIRGIRNQGPMRADAVPHFFKNLRVKTVPPVPKATLLIYMRSVLCAGVKTIDAAKAAYDSIADQIIAGYNTPANMAAELAQVTNGVISPEVALSVLNYKVADGGETLVPKAVPEEEEAIGDMV